MWEKVNTRVIFCLGLSVIKVAQALVGIMRFLLWGLILCGYSYRPLNTHSKSYQFLLFELSAILLQSDSTCQTSKSILAGITSCEHYESFSLFRIILNTLSCICLLRGWEYVFPCSNSQKRVLRFNFCQNDKLVKQKQKSEVLICWERWLLTVYYL